MQFTQRVTMFCDCRRIALEMGMQLAVQSTLPSMFIDPASFERPHLNMPTLAMVDISHSNTRAHVVRRHAYSNVCSSESLRCSVSLVHRTDIPSSGQATIIRVESVSICSRSFIRMACMQATVVLPPKCYHLRSTRAETLSWVVSRTP